MNSSFKCTMCNTEFDVKTAREGFTVEFCPFCGTWGYLVKIMPYAPTNAGTVVVKGSKGF